MMRPTSSCSAPHAERPKGRIDSAPGCGTTMSVYLPPTAAPPREPELPRVRPPMAVTRKTILRPRTSTMCAT